MGLPKNLRYSLGHLGRLLVLMGFVILVPMIVAAIYSEWSFRGFNIYLGYLIPSVASISVGIVLQRTYEIRKLNLVQGLFVTGFAWILISFFSAFPFYFITDMSYLNSFFEAVSGFTTTGITMITNLDPMPHSILFWRSFIQWIGGLGIITFFLFVGVRGISEHILFRGESHKIKSGRPSPNVAKTIKYLWAIYGGFTAALIILLLFLGVDSFDSVNHAFTTLSTGGFSPHDQSIEYFRLNGFENFRLIEYTITFFMFLGGTSFLVHYNVLKGRLRALWDSLEVKMWILLLLGSTLLIVYETNGLGLIQGGLEPVFRNSVFQVVSIGTTTGFQTSYIGGFGALAKQIFLVLMVIGGCVASTGGGLKVGRIAIILKGIWNRVKRTSRPREMLTPLTVDGEKVDHLELERVFVIFAAWIFLLVVGGLVVAAVSNHGALACFSGMFSALGNIGPSFLSVGEVVALSPLVKVLFIFAMLIGRLEILPIFILLNREVWK